MLKLHFGQLRHSLLRRNDNQSRLSSKVSLCADRPHAPTPSITPAGVNARATVDCEELLVGAASSRDSVMSVMQIAAGKPLPQPGLYLKA